MLYKNNAAMIAASGYYEYLKGNFADGSLNASAMDSVVADSGTREA